MNDKKRKPTQTSTFGTAGRVSHDSSRFYGSRLYSDLDQAKETPYRENPLPADVVDRILCQSSEKMDALPDESIHLMVTSPPYNVQKEYAGSFIRRLPGYAQTGLG